MITPGNQTSQTTPNWNKKSLTRSKDLLDNLSLKLFCDVIFLSLPGQSDIGIFILTINQQFTLFSLGDIATKITGAVVRINDKHEESSFQNLEKQLSI